MRDAASSEDRAFLASFRGRFAEPRKEKIKGLFFSYLLFAGFPGIFVYALFGEGSPQYPFSGDQWALIVLIPASMLLGEFVRRYTGCSYIFDGEVVRQISRSGRIMKEIRISEIIQIRIDDSLPASMHLRTERSAMGILLTPDLREEVRKRANQMPEPTAASGRGSS